MKFIHPLFLIYLLFEFTNSLYENSRSVINFTPTDFQTQVLNSQELWVVAFYGKFNN
jgi:hypothetical protein